MLVTLSGMMTVLADPLYFFRMPFSITNVFFAISTTSIKICLIISHSCHINQLLKKAEFILLRFCYFLFTFCLHNAV